MFLLLKIFAITMIIVWILALIVYSGPIAWIIGLLILFGLRNFIKENMLIGRLINVVVWLAIIFVIVGIILTILGAKI